MTAVDHDQAATKISSICSNFQAERKAFIAAGKAESLIPIQLMNSMIVITYFMSFKAEKANLLLNS